nr:hypothetical protein [Tanacetum cinerariifolium]
MEPNILIFVFGGVVDEAVVESFNAQKAKQKVKRHNPSPDVSSVAKNHMERLTLGSDEFAVGQSNNMDIDGQSNEQDKTNKRKKYREGLKWDPYSSAVAGDELRASRFSWYVTSKIYIELTAPLDKDKEESGQGFACFFSLLIVVDVVAVLIILLSLGKDGKPMKVARHVQFDANKGGTPLDDHVSDTNISYVVDDTCEVSFMADDPVHFTTEDDSGERMKKCKLGGRIQRIGFARALIEVTTDKELKQEITMDVPIVDGEGQTKERMSMEYEWKPSRCIDCQVFGHASEQCPKRVVEPAKDTIDAQNDGFTTDHQDDMFSVKELGESSAGNGDASLFRESDSNKLDSENEVEEVFNEYATKNVGTKGASTPSQDGDFNVALNMEDSFTGSSGMNSAMCDFKDCVIHIEVFDINNSGLHFTWNQKPKGGGGILKKLDRIMGNIEFVDMFLGKFLDVVSNPWNINVAGHSMFQVVQNMKTLKKPFRKLLHDQGNLHKRVNRLRVELDEVQKSIDQDPSNTALRDDEAAYIQAFNEAKIDEGRFLRQKVKLEWLEVGDSNSAYFHKSIKSRNQRSRIDVVTTANNVDVTGSCVPGVFVSHYESFLGTNMACDDLNTTGLFNKKVYVASNANMIRLVTNDEIKRAMFDIGDDKASGPDGYMSAFFKKGWDVVGHDVCTVIRDFLELMHNYHRDRGPPSINGDTHGFFKGKIGLRQGDPLSPYLFTLVMEILTLILQRRVRMSETYRYHNHCEELQIINVFFADDLFIFARGDVDSARVIIDSLDEFKLVSGLVPSIPKSTTFFCNVLNHVKISILNIMPFSEGELPVKYLGVSLISSRLLNKDCKVLVEKTRNRIGDWKNKSLSFADRLQLWRVYNLQSCVVDLLIDREWNWPHVWFLKAPNLGLIAAPILDVSRQDYVRWCDTNGNMCEFSMKCVWEVLRPRGNEVWCLVRRLAGMEHVPPILEDIMMWFQPMVVKRTVKSVVGKLLFAASSYYICDPEAEYALSKLLQMGTVTGYQNEFEMLINRVTGIPESLLIPFYISGLKLHLQRELNLVSRPTTLGDVFPLAHIIEARFEDTNNQAVHNNGGDKKDPNVNDKQEVKKADDQEIENVKDEERKNVKDQQVSEHTINETADIVTSLQSEVASLDAKGSLDANEEIKKDLT